MEFVKKYAKSLLYPTLFVPILYALYVFGDFINTSFSFHVGRMFMETYHAYIQYLPLLYAASFAMFFAKRKDGTSVLSGMIGYIVLIHIASNETLAKALEGCSFVLQFNYTSIQNGCMGIMCGLLGASIYNRFYNVQLPSGLAFFSGKRLVPIITGLVMIIIGSLLIIIWPLMYRAIAWMLQVRNIETIGPIVYMWLQVLLSFVGLSSLDILHEHAIFFTNQTILMQIVIPLLLILLYNSKHKVALKEWRLVFLLVGVGALIQGDPLLFHFLLFTFNPLYMFLFYALQSMLWIWQIAYQPSMVSMLIGGSLLCVISFYFARNHIDDLIHKGQRIQLDEKQVADFIYAVGGIENIITLHILEEKLYITLEEEMLIRTSEIEALPKSIQIEIHDNELIVQGVAPKALYDALDAYITQADASLVI